MVFDCTVHIYRLSAHFNPYRNTLLDPRFILCILLFIEILALGNIFYGQF